MPVWADGVDLTTGAAVHRHLRTEGGIRSLGHFVATAAPGRYPLRVLGMGKPRAFAVAIGSAPELEPDGSTTLALAGSVSEVVPRVDAAGWTATITQVPCGWGSRLTPGWVPLRRSASGSLTSRFVSVARAGRPGRCPSCVVRQRVR